MKQELKGTGLIRGTATGKVRIIDCSRPKFEIHKIDDTDGELGRFIRALKTYCDNTRDRIELIKKTMGRREAEILNTHIKMTHDLAIRSELITKISGGMCAEQSLSEVCESYINRFLDADAEFVRRLAIDVMDVETCIMNLLLGKKDVAVEHFDEDTVVVTNEITPSVIARLDRLHTKAIVVGRGSKHSHSAHLVKAIKIIGVHNIENVASLLHNGETVVVNGSAGTVKVVA